MAKEFDNRNRGSLWGNKDKTVDSQPDFKGSLNVNGQEFWVSAWKRKPDASDKAPALSFSIQPKEDSVKKHTTDTTSSRGSFDDFDDDPLPF